MATRPAAIRTGNGSGFMAAILPGRATPRPPEDCVSNRIGRLVTRLFAFDSA
jgi:hypothetical protein